MKLLGFLAFAVVISALAYFIEASPPSDKPKNRR